MTPDQRGLLHDFWGPGMRADVADRAVVDELAPATGDWTLTKWRYSAFHRTDLLDRMRDGGRDQLVICGVYAHVGVLMTACDAFSSDIQPFLVADAIADFTLDHHQLALAYAAQRCAVVATTDALLEQLGERNGRQTDLLARVLAPNPGPFALLHRPQTLGRRHGRACWSATSTTLGRLAELELAAGGAWPPSDAGADPVPADRRARVRLRRRRRRRC